MKHSNMRRLRHLLGDRPVLFGSSRKRFLGAILKRCAAENKVGDVNAADLVRDQYNPSVEELDWATASTSSAAVTGMSCNVMQCYVMVCTFPSLLSSSLFSPPG